REWPDVSRSSLNSILGAGWARPPGIEHRPVRSGDFERNRDVTTTVTCPRLLCNVRGRTIGIMNRRRIVVLALIVLCAHVAPSQSVNLTGDVRSGVPHFQIHYTGAKDDANGFATIHSITIRQSGKTIQTIRFSGEDVPRVRDFRKAVQLRDINCDGYKDLLIEHLTGVHGDSWYHLYLFNRNSGMFVAYPQFSQLAFKQVDCRTREITTYVNSGQAGCAYESALYRWVNDSLTPVRIESQEASGEQNDTFTRTIQMWSGTKREVRKLRVPADDCHR
ncbi:MAG: hypothetical protein WBQ72_17550, partial [Terriglobales bacterium]